MVSFIETHGEEYGVEPICRVLPIVPSTYYRHKGFRDEPGRLCARKKRDKDLRAEIQRIWEENFRVYGARKIWKQMNREGIEAARCTVERLMREDTGSGSRPEVQDDGIR